MNYGIIISLLSISSVTLNFSPDFKMEWNEFVTSFNKSYTSKQEEIYRFKIWRRNLGVIDKHNKEADSGIHSYRLGMNKFGDMTSEEFLEIMTGYIPQDSNDQKDEFKNFHTPVASLPLLVDWRRNGYVTPVKDQYQCGSCWAFSATGALEGQHFKKTGKLVSLSEQNLVDCSYAEGNNGCYGGLMRYAFQYVANNTGIDLEEFYRYIGASHLFCHYKKIFVGATATGYKTIQQNNETALKIAVATVGPISVSMAALDTFQLYKSGVYYNKDCVGADLNHGVLIVGYGTYFGDDYWLVKNSWGADWGMEGYFMMARNRGNACGLASDASYPTM